MKLHLPASLRRFVNALLQHLTAGGVTLTYTGGQAAITLPHEMSYTFTGDVALSASESAGQWVTINTAKSRGLTLSGQISGDGGFSVAGGSTTLSLTRCRSLPLPPWPCSGSLPSPCAAGADERRASAGCNQGGCMNAPCSRLVITGQGAYTPSTSSVSEECSCAGMRSRRTCVTRRPSEPVTVARKSFTRTCSPGSGMWPMRSVM